MFKSNDFGGRLSMSQTQDNFRISFSVPLWWFPLALLVAKEYVIISKKLLSCPDCGASEFKLIKQGLLADRSGKLPAGGDLIAYERQRYNTQIELLFTFRGFLPNKDVFVDLIA